MIPTRRACAHENRCSGLIFFGVILLAGGALAQDSGVNDTFSQNNVDVQLQVVPGCSVSQPNGSDFGTLNFGTYPLLANTIDQQVTMNFSLQCATGVTATILLDGGGSGNVNTRRMTRGGGSETVLYQLYIDSGRTTVWNNTSGLSVMGSGQSISYPVYGRVASQANPIAGTYSDMLQVTINF